MKSRLLCQATLFLIISFAFASALSAQEPDMDNLPQDVLEIFGLGTFAQTYSISARINPFYLRGDFDGDGISDYAVLVVAKKNQAKGIAIWLSGQKKVYILGAGNPFKFTGAQSADFDFINTWQVYGKKGVERGVGAGPPPKLLGEAILAGKKESASGLIYWNGKGFSWYQQGD